VTETDPTVEAPVEAPTRPSEPRVTRVRRPGRSAPRGRPRGSKNKPKEQPEEQQLEQAIRGILQLPAAGFIIAGQRVQSTPLVADGATILVHGPGVAKAIVEIAENDPRVMALLEKVLAFGPYGLLIAALMPAIAQGIRNHNEPAAPILEGFGAVTPEQIISAASLDVPVDVNPDGKVGAQSNPNKSPN
jgi:hypothetical protein